MSALPLKADILHCGRDRRYSITSSARASKDWGTDKPSALAPRSPTQLLEPFQKCQMAHLRADRDFFSLSQWVCDRLPRESGVRQQ